MKNVFFLAVSCLLFAGLAKGADDGSKIAVVDMARVIGEHPQTETNRSVIKGELEDFEAERQKIQDRIQESQKELQQISEDSQNEALSEEARKAKRGEGRKKMAELERFVQESRIRMLRREKEISDQKLRMQRRVVAKIQEVIQAAAAERGWGLVLDASGIGANGSETVLYYPESVDVTQDILKLLNKKEP